LGRLISFITSDRILQVLAAKAVAGTSHLCPCGRKRQWETLRTNLALGLLQLTFAEQNSQAKIPVHAPQLRRPSSPNQLDERFVDFKETEPEFATLAESLPQFVWASDAGGRHDYFNRRWYEYTGLSREESIGSGWIRALHPDDRSSMQRRWQAALTTGVPYEIEYRFQGRDGAYRWFLGRALPVLDGTGGVKRWFGTCTDIQAQKDSEAALRALDAQHRLALDAARLGTWTYNIENGVVNWDARACKIFGIPEAGLLSLPLEETFRLAHPDDIEELQKAVERAVRPGASGKYEVEYRTAPEKAEIRWVRSTGRVEYRGTGDERQAVRINGICRDVTEHRAAQDIQELLTRELSHRVKNLFAIATGLVGMTARTAENPRAMAETLRARFGALSRAHELIQPAYESETGRSIAQADVAALVEAVVTPYRAGEHVISLHGEALSVGANAMTSLALVLHELATNAAKYGALSAEGGVLTVTWELENDNLVLSWTERGGPPVEGDPSFEGFGTKLAQRSIEGQLGGRIERDWHRDGLAVRMMLPLDRLAQ
jgi:PAS domain S-box-containing protein